MIFLPKLTYDYGDLSPYISMETMWVHHTKHHQKYVDNTNQLMTILQDSRLDSQVRSALMPRLSFNLSGHINHSIFWKMLSPRSYGRYNLDPKSSLYLQIKLDFGSFSRFESLLKSEALNLNGSGWVALGWDNTTGRLFIYSFTGQDRSYFSSTSIILLIDIWEHAYYLDYRSDKKRYMTEIWEVLDWSYCLNRFNKATKRIDR